MMRSDSVYNSGVSKDGELISIYELLSGEAPIFTSHPKPGLGYITILISIFSLITASPNALAHQSLPVVAATPVSYDSYPSRA